MKSLGIRGEEIASRFLIKKGFKILFKNYRLKFGEIDIIALDKNSLVFVEVKTRFNTEFGKPFEAINISKQNKLRKLADCFIAFNQPEAKFFRFDVISILINKDKREVVHIENAF
ncbi:MAG: YraN family protein [Candidatus Subteraquimicrobiales bacterium]|nr:YraN family protein [Candidatus Subteraquimicrobiales bacterium]